MLTKKQWIWLAEHHEGVRTYSFAILSLIALAYLIFIVNAGIERGKSPESYAPMLGYAHSFECHKEKLAGFILGPFGGNTPPKPGYKSAMHALSRNDKRGRDPSVIDIEALFKHPECVGAALAGGANNPNEDALLIYDSRHNKVVYKIEQFNHLTKDEVADWLNVLPKEVPRWQSTYIIIR